MRARKRKMSKEKSPLDISDEISDIGGAKKDLEVLLPIVE